MANKKYLDLDSLKEYHLKLKPVIESKANSSDVYNKTDVYNRSEVDSALDSKSNVGHTHDQYITEQNVYTKEQIDLALESKSDISHTHDQYLTDIGIDILFDGSDTLKGTATDYKILGVDSTKTYYLSGTKFIGTGCTNITITPITATSATCTYDEETGIVSWTIYGASSSGPVSANLSWTGAPGILTSTKDGIKTNIGYFNTINGESVVSKTGTKDFDLYSKSEVDSKLNLKANSSDVYTTSQVDTKLSEKANSSDVYTTTQVDTKLSSKADTSNVYNKSEINTKLNAKANVSDVYTTSQVDTKLSEKANSSDVYTTKQIDNKLSSKADTSNVYTTTQVDNKLNEKANASDVYTATQVDNKLSGKLPIFGMASKGETKTYNRYAQKGYTGGISTYWYYKIATLPAYNSSGNYASLIITGRIGGWESANMSSINALVFNRGEEGIVAIDLAKTSSRTAYNICDIVCYREEHGETSVYLKCASYFTFDINIESYQHDIILPTSVSKLTSVTGTEQVKLSTTASRLEVYNGNAYVGGKRLVKSNESLKNPNSLTFGSQTYDGSAAKTITASDLNTYTKTEVDTSLNAKANASDVYSKSDVDTKLSKKADKSATLSGYGITNAYTKTETDNLINSKTKTIVFDTYNKFIEFLEDTSQATYDYFNIGDSIYIKEEGSDYWISGKEDIVEDGYAYRYISGTTGSQLLGTDNIFRKTVTENIGTTYTSVTVDGIEPIGGSCGYSNFSWNSSTGVVKITLESLQPNKNVTARLKCHVSASGGGDYGYYYISNIGPKNYVDLTNAQTVAGTKSFTSGLKVSGRAANDGDDEGIVVNTASNGYAGVCLGNPTGRRSVFYLNNQQAFWRYNTGIINYDLIHPGKSGTIATKDDIPDISGKADSGHTHGVATTTKDGFMSSTQVGMLNYLHSTIHQYSGGNYGDATNIDSPNGTYSMQIGDSGFTIDDGPPHEDPNNILQVNADVFTYNGQNVLISYYLHTIRAFQNSSPPSYIVFSFISTQSTAYTKSTLYSAFPDKGFQASGFYNYSSSNAGYRVNIVYPQSATTILFDYGNNSGATATYGGTYFVDNVRKIT